MIIAVSSNHKLDTKQHVKNEEKAVPIQSLLNKTQLTTKVNNQSKENPVNNVLLSDLGGSLGGALVGGVFFGLAFYKHIILIEVSEEIFSNQEKRKI